MDSTLLLRLKSLAIVQHFCYHMDNHCYKKYTLKKTIDKIKVKEKIICFVQLKPQRFLSNLNFHMLISTMLAYHICQHRCRLNVVLMSHNVKIFSYHCSHHSYYGCCTIPCTMLLPPQYYQKIFYKSDLATDLVFKFFMFSLSDLFTIPRAFR